MYNKEMDDWLMGKDNHPDPPYERDCTTDNKQDEEPTEEQLKEFNELFNRIKKEHEQKAEQKKKTIHLSPPTPLEEADDLDDNGYRAISERVYKTLPEMLRVPTLRFSDGEERELFLIGALGVVSGMLPHYMGNYFGSQMGTNLYCFVMGRYGTGKGALKWARMLGEIVHQRRLDEAKEQQERYKRDKVHYNMQLAQYNKGQLAEQPQEPQPPRHLKLFIPANTTKTAVMQLLEENDGNGIIFESEGDTLADMLRQDYGNFSDILRKAFHHEPLSFFRRANNEDVTVQEPALSVILSGTHDQLLKLIPSIDNGLYSRFMFYILHGNDDFRNPFEQNDFSHSIHMERYASKYAELYVLLSRLETSKQFSMTTAQQKKFYEHYKYVKEWTQDKHGTELDGSVNRMAVMAYRIAMILTILRKFEANPQLPETTLVCTDADLQNALDIMDVLSYNATDIYKYLSEYGMSRANLNANKDEEKHVNACLTFRRQGMSLRKIAVDVFGSVNCKDKVKRILRDYGIQ